MAQRFTLDETISLYRTSPSSPYGGRAVVVPEESFRWPDGTGEGEADEAWARADGTIADSADVDVDLAALTQGPEGSSVQLAEVRWLRIVTDQPLTLTPSAADGWTALGASASVLIPAGTTTIRAGDGGLPVSGSDKSVNLANGSGSEATYTLVLVGTSA